MSVRYSAVKWNHNKRVYDYSLLAGILLYLTMFMVVGKLISPGGREVGNEILLIRAFGTCALVMLHLVLCIGPLARFDRRFVPVLYNRRHLGVATFIVGLFHGVLATGYYHAFGRLNPLVSLLGSNTQFDSLAAFPFEILGVIGLLILFLLAATSHDFWQRNLSASVWKAVHMLVYPAYGLLVLHVTLGALQSEDSRIYVIVVGTGLVTVVGLHLAAGWRERLRDGRQPQREASACDNPWIDVGSVDEIPENRAKVVCLKGRERVAVFRSGDRISAVTNVCAHQRGPLGEGKIVDGCITCPWHGWQYLPENGRSPPPFQERIATYQVQVVNRRVLLDFHPLPPGTATRPAYIEEPRHEPDWAITK